MFFVSFCLNSNKMSDNGENYRFAFDEDNYRQIFGRVRDLYDDLSESLVIYRLGGHEFRFGINTGIIENDQVHGVLNILGDDGQVHSWCDFNIIMESEFSEGSKMLTFYGDMHLSQEGANALKLFFPGGDFSAYNSDEDESEDPAQNLGNRFEDVADDDLDEDDEEEESCSELV